MAGFETAFSGVVGSTLGAVATVVAAKLQKTSRERGNPPNEQAAKTRQHIIDELEEVKKLVLGPILRQDLLIQVDLKNVEKQNGGRIVASIRVTSSYRLYNFDLSPAQFKFVAGLDASHDFGGDITGDLSVVDLEGKALDSDCNGRLKFSVINDPRNVERQHREEITIPGSSSWDFKWTTSYFDVDLPYTEFWAAVYPTIGMTVKVTARPEFGIRVESDFYRQKQQEVPMIYDEVTGVHSSTAHGAFLPYQGAFVRIQQDP